MVSTPLADDAVQPLHTLDNEILQGGKVLRKAVSAGADVHMRRFPQQLVIACRRSDLLTVPHKRMHAAVRTDRVRIARKDICQWGNVLCILALRLDAELRKGIQRAAERAVDRVEQLRLRQKVLIIIVAEAKVVVPQRAHLHRLRAGFLIEVGGRVEAVAVLAQLVDEVALHHALDRDIVREWLACLRARAALKHGVLIVLIPAGDIVHLRLRAGLRRLYNDIEATRRDEIALFLHGAVGEVHFKQVAARDVRRVVHAITIKIGRAVGGRAGLRLELRQILDVGVGHLIRLFQVRHIHTALVDLHLLRQEVQSAELAVIEEAHRAIAHVALHLQRAAEVERKHVADSGRIIEICQQDPRLGLIGAVAGLEQVGLFVQLDLIGALGSLPGRIAAALDLRQLAVVDGFAVRCEQSHASLGPVGFVLAGLDPLTALVHGIVAHEEHRRHIVIPQERHALLCLHTPGAGTQRDRIVRALAQGGQVQRIAALERHGAAASRRRHNGILLGKRKIHRDRLPRYAGWQEERRRPVQLDRIDAGVRRGGIPHCIELRPRQGGRSLSRQAEAGYQHSRRQAEQKQSFHCLTPQFSGASRTGPHVSPIIPVFTEKSKAVQSG